MRRLLASLQFSLVAAGQNFTRNLAVSMAGVFTMGLILLLVGGALLLTHSIGDILSQQEKSASELRIYLQDSVSLRSIQNYEVSLSQDPRIKGVHFTNKDTAIVTAQNQPGFDVKGAISILGSNPLPASLDLDVTKLSDLSSLDAYAKQLPIIDHTTSASATDYNPDVIPRLQTVIFVINAIGFVLICILSAISLVIIMNTIRTAVYIRRTEIEIMKLVGATDWFVRWPFILEGILGGILAAALGSVIVGSTYRILLGQGHNFFGVGYDGLFLIEVLLGLVCGGAALGAFGSYLGVRRFLKV